SKVTVSLTCHGGCDAKDAPKNIAAHHKESFEFVKGKNHIPQLDPAWIKETAEEKPGLYYTRWDAKGDGKVQEAHVSIDRVGGNMMVACGGEMRGDGGGAVEKPEKLGRALTAEPAKAEAPKADAPK